MDPWPADPVTNYSDRYGIGRVKSVGIDLGKNLWVLDGDRIGVVRADTQKLVWMPGAAGQAGEGQSSTVICGGAAGRAYVGYNAPDLQQDPEYPGIHTNFIVTAKPCEVPVNEQTCFPFSSRRLQYYRQGDVDAVKLDGSGQVAFETHINQSRRANTDASGKPFIQTGPTVVDGVSLGIRNSNDHHFDEDRAMLSCASVLRGPNKGDVFFGTNHGVVRIRDLTYNAHRHPVWFDANGSQYAGYTYGLGIAPDGDVLIANEWNFGTVTPDTKMENWDDTTTPGINQQKVKSSYLQDLNSQSEFDYWRAFQQTTDGKYYLGSKSLGLWEMTILSSGNPYQKGTRVGADVAALNDINALASTNDGSLFIGTNAGGLYRLTPAKALEKVANVRGSKVLQLVYDGSGTSGMLLVLTSDGLTVLRGH
ncbi:hypothetical protein [Corallococcus exercitus]|uniref:Uncharacterized protein n=1 Tax=Corallococcus exercitus TaxID=2316736 RepID=A0A7Y4K3B6_9BACT|nr:hypothetical protein [Corallococcus exercitus]NOK15022.1 hypothetical protein [Corallococcus exercitus]